MLCGRRDAVAAELETYLENDRTVVSLTTELERLDAEINDVIKERRRRAQPWPRSG